MRLGRLLDGPGALPLQQPSAAMRLRVGLTAAQLQLVALARQPLRRVLLQALQGARARAAAVALLATATAMAGMPTAASCLSRLPLRLASQPCRLGTLAS